MSTTGPAANDPLLSAARAWIAADPDPDTAAELSRLLIDDPAGRTELADRMSGPPRFGTAGLRGPVRAGPNGMNTAVVITTTAAVARWLVEHGHGGGVVVLGRDARHGSDRFSEAAAGVLVAAGFDVRVLPRPLPTPVLAFAVRALEAVAGIQITASHNPPGDNGYKLYLGDGRQIIPPVDTEIEHLITLVGAAADVPRSTGWLVLDETVVDQYRHRVSRLARSRSTGLRVALTPLHGVGGELTRSILESAGHQVFVVAEQFAPDPDFPTVTFPNPEEPGAADALLALATHVEADLAIALDPDADRCAVGVRDDGGWRMLRGDETGVLLGEHILSTTDSNDPLVATTIVSSAMLAAVAAVHGARHVETLTGFKWLSRAGTGLVYAYEEAIGHCVDPEAVADKDGVSTALMICDLAVRQRGLGRTLIDAHDQLMITHGVYLTDQISLRESTPDQVRHRMDQLRAHPPRMLMSTPLTVEDLRPSDNTLRLSGPDFRVMIRPSGTEPKLKCYLQITTPAPTAADLPATKQTARTRLRALQNAVTALITTHRD